MGDKLSNGLTGQQQVKQAMSTLLNQQEATKYLLQASPDDIVMVLTFNSQVINQSNLAAWTVAGNDPSQLQGLLKRIEDATPGGNTDIYAPVALGLDLMKQQGIGDRFPAIILMTDGQSNHGSLDEVKAALSRTGLNQVPVYAITFGEADASQLQQVTDLTHGLVYDGTKDLITAFRNARGNN